jgi:hypothetical protein
MYGESNPETVCTLLWSKEGGYTKKPLGKPLGPPHYSRSIRTVSGCCTCFFLLKTGLEPIPPPHPRIHSDGFIEMNPIGEIEGGCLCFLVYLFCGTVLCYSKEMSLLCFGLDVFYLSETKAPKFDVVF